MQWLHRPVAVLALLSAIFCAGSASAQQTAVDQIFPPLQPLQPYQGQPLPPLQVVGLYQAEAPDCYTYAYVRFAGSVAAVDKRIGGLLPQIEAAGISRALAMQGFGELCRAAVGSSAANSLSPQLAPQQLAPQQLARADSATLRHVAPECFPGTPIPGDQISEYLYSGFAQMVRDMAAQGHSVDQIRQYCHTTWTTPVPSASLGSRVPTGDYGIRELEGQRNRLHSCNPYYEGSDGRCP
jgi:hypothetical protein